MNFSSFMADCPTLDNRLNFINSFADPIDRMEFLTQLLTTARPRSSHWTSKRADWVKRHPACAACGALKPVEVHHKLPFHIAPELELEDSNLITLCESAARNCHLTFGHVGNWSLWCERVEAFTEEYFKAWQKARGIS